MKDRAMARRLAQKHLAEGDALGWFEALYAAVGGEAEGIPWADLKANRNVAEWLDRRELQPGLAAIVVGCGLGDDAEELARRGLEVTAFDISPTAIEWCRRRFAGSRVKYVVADLLEGRRDWEGRFDLVVESYTLQVLPEELRGRAMEKLAGFLADRGELLVVCRGREEEDAKGEMPWPLTRGELVRLAEGAGLVERGFEDYWDGEEAGVRRFRVVYARAREGRAD